VLGIDRIVLLNKGLEGIEVIDRDLKKHGKKDQVFPRGLGGSPIPGNGSALPVFVPYQGPVFLRF
jgi:hypothetical protein